MVPGELPRREIDDRDGVAGMRIPAVDAVAVYGNVGELVIGRDGHIVRRDAHVQVGYFLKGRWIEEPDVPADFVDHDQSVRAGGVVGIDAAGGEDECRGSESGDGEECALLRMAMSWIIYRRRDGARPG